MADQIEETEQKRSGILKIDQLDTPDQSERRDSFISARSITSVQFEPNLEKIRENPKKQPEGALAQLIGGTLNAVSGKDNFITLNSMYNNCMYYILHICNCM